MYALIFLSPRNPKRKERNRKKYSGKEENKDRESKTRGSNKGISQNYRMTLFGQFEINLFLAKISEKKMFKLVTII